MSEMFRWMVKFMSGFQFFDPKYFEERTIIYDDFKTKIKSDETSILNHFRNIIATELPRRVVIDSINPVESYVGNYREFLFNLVDLLKRWDVTVVITLEKKGNAFDDEMYMADGIVELIMKDEGQYMRRYTKIRKMRGTNHSLSVHPLSITSSGISVLKANY